LLVDLQNGESYFNFGSTPAHDIFKALLEAEGFAVERFDASRGMEGLMQASTVVTEKYDVVLYLAKLVTKSNQTVVRIEWAQPMGANAPVYVTSVPTIFVSVENPYHLLDAPR
ncbi:MAG TPA: hypothetical protein PK954_18105, partial [Anaerolineales bacterium]|nr:hypothetical protein [Anaerolineales bacterium]